MNDQILVHHGVKGMKWGVRRFRDKDGSLTAEGKARAKREAEHDADNAKKQDYLNAAKNRRNLSDEELLARIGRLEKEKKLKELTEDNLYNDRMMSAGKKATREVLDNAGKKVAGAALAGGVAYFGKALITGEFDSTQLATYLKSGPFDSTKKMFNPENLDQVAAYLFPNPNKKK